MTSAKLLAAAAHTIEELGVDKAGVNAVAERSGYNKQLIYRYFGGWNGLLKALYATMLTEIHNQALERSQRENRSFFLAYFDQFQQELSQHKPLRVLLLWQLQHPQTQVSHDFLQIRTSALTMVFSQQGSLPEVGEEGRAILLLDGLIYQSLSKPH